MVGRSPRTLQRTNLNCGHVWRHVESRVAKRVERPKDVRLEGRDGDPLAHAVAAAGGASRARQELLRDVDAALQVV